MVSDCEDISLANLLKNISQAYEVVLRLYPIPPIFIRIAAKLLGQDVLAKTVG